VEPARDDDGGTTYAVGGGEPAHTVGEETVGSPGAVGRGRTVHGGQQRL